MFPVIDKNFKKSTFCALILSKIAFLLNDETCHWLILTGRYAGWVPVGSGHHPDYQLPVPAAVGCGSGDSGFSLALYWNPKFRPFSEVNQGIRKASVSGQSTLHLYLYCKDAVQVVV